MKFTKEDKKYLISILKNHHECVNGITIKECPEDNCWYKLIIEKLKK